MISRRENMNEELIKKEDNLQKEINTLSIQIEEKNTSNMKETKE